MTVNDALWVEDEESEDADGQEEEHEALQLSREDDDTSMGGIQVVHEPFE